MTSQAIENASQAAAASKRRSGSRRLARGPGRWIVLSALCLTLLLFAFLFVLALSNAVKTPTDYAAHGALVVPYSFSLKAIGDFWEHVDFTRKPINSALISVCIALAGVFLSLLNSYAIGVGKIKGGGNFLVLVLFGVMIPQESLVYSLYRMAKSVGLFESRLFVIIVFSVLQSAFCTYLLASVMTTFPQELLESARMDGASAWQILWLIAFPILRPTLAVLAVFFFIWTWNEFLLPLVLLVSNDNQTVSVAMGVHNGQYVSDPTTTAAAAPLGIAPTLFFFLIFQRTLTRGIVAGAVK
jgi:raffinose/stachyose/melibiose transport system permease protein